MTREEYLDIRPKVTYDMIWEYYTHIVPESERMFTNVENFINVVEELSERFGSVINIQHVIEYFDNKFETVRVIDIATKQVIKMI